MQNNPKDSKEKIHNINEFSHGEWICFLLPNNKKVVGIIVEYMLPSKEDDNFFQSVVMVNYIDEDGMSGNIKISDINKTQRVIGIDMNTFFSKKFSIKTENLISKNNSRKIARDFIKQSNLKRLGKINKN